MSNHTVAVRYVQGLLRSAHRAGVDVDELLANTGFPPALLRDPHTRATPGQCMRIVRHLSRALDDELLGLGVHPRRCGTFAMMCLGGIHAPDLDKAVRRCTRFSRMLEGDPYFLLHCDTDAAAIEIELTHTNDPDHLLPESILCVLHRFFEWLIDEPLELESVELPYQPPDYVDDLVQIFGRRPTFGAARTALSFDVRLLSAPTVRSHASLVRFLSRFPACILRRRHYGITVSEHVRALIERGLDTKIPSSAVIAAKLAMSQQTLRRQLATQGTSVSEIKNEVLRDHAITELARGIAVDTLADQLGFSAVSAFHRAFKRWTGVTPADPVSYMESDEATVMAFPVAVAKQPLVQFSSGQAR